MIRVKIVVSCDDDGEQNQARPNHTIVYQVQTSEPYGKVLDKATEFLQNKGFDTDPSFGDAWEDDPNETLWYDDEDVEDNYFDDEDDSDE